MSSFVYNDISYNILTGTTVEVGINTSYSGNPNVTIPQTVTNNSITYTVASISAFAFTNFSNLTSINLSNCTSILSISRNSFASCRNLTSVILPSSITSIDQYAFYNCSKLTSINLSNCTSLLSIGFNSFSFCFILTSITFPSSLSSIGNNGFNACNTLQNVTFNGLSIPSLGTTCFGAISSTATAYYQYGTTNASTLTQSGFFANYVVLNAPYPCFKEGSKILTDKGYLKIENLKKGDLVKTLTHDFKPINMIGKREIYHPNSKLRIKDQLYKCSQNEFSEIFEPLIITGCHSILVDDFISEEQREKTIEVNGGIFITDDKYRLPACVDERISVYETPGTYTIYHIALENDDYYMNYGVFANGLLVETCSKRYLKELSGMELI